MHANHCIPVGLVHLHQRLVAQDAGVVHENIDMAKCRQRVLKNAFPAFNAADVCHARDSRAAFFANARCHFFRGLLRIVVHDNRRALTRQQLRICTSKAGTRTGHYRYLTVQQTHFVTPLFGNTVVRRACAPTAHAVHERSR